MTNEEIVKEVKKIVDTKWSQGAKDFAQLKELLSKYEFEKRNVSTRTSRKDDD